MTDRSLKKAGALILTVIILVAYSAYVKVVERRAVTELSRPGLLRELGAGVIFGAALFSLTIGVMAILGVYQITLVEASSVSNASKNIRPIPDFLARYMAMSAFLIN